MPTVTEMIQATINACRSRSRPGATILDAARQVSVHIPTLCKHPDLDATAACGICIVRVAGSQQDAPRLLHAGRAGHGDHDGRPGDHPGPPDRDRDDPVEAPQRVPDLRPEPELRAADDRRRLRPARDLLWTASFRTCRSTTPPAPSSSTRASASPAAAASRSASRSRTCGRSASCSAASTRASPPAGDISLADSPCVRCGQCSAHCPTGAIVEYDETAGGLGQAPRPGCLLRGPAGAGGPRRHRRGVRLPGRNKPHRQDLRRSPADGLQGRLRHQLRRRPDDHGGGPRVRRALHQRKVRAAAHHHVLPVVGGLHGEVPRRHDPPLLVVQVPPGDGRRAGQDLLRREDGAGPGQGLCRLGHALHGQEVRDHPLQGDAFLRLLGR